MKFIPALFLGFLVAASGASAQTSFSNSVSLVPSPFVAAVSAPNANFTPAPAPTSSLSADFAGTAGFAPEPTPVPEPAAMPQNVQGVFEKYDTDIAAGYTYMRFYEVPGDTLNGNGFNISGTYWYRDWWGPDGEFFATYSTQPGVNSWVGIGAGGLRVRKVLDRGLDVWAHGLAGVAYLAPKSPYGNEWAAAAVAGVGVDLNAHHRHVAYRLAVDAVGTHFFKVYQISPKVSVGVVFKF
jgi:hypothetical protein